MGQYWVVANLDKREFVEPHKLGSGLKLWEQLGASPGTGAALIVLLAAMPEARGGGDFALTSRHKAYAAIAKRTIGRWAGDRVALVGDYADRGDLKAKDCAETIYDLCGTPRTVRALAAHLRKRAVTEENSSKRKKLRTRAQKYYRLITEDKLFKDISGDVARVIEHELRGKFVGTGWCRWEPGI